MTYEGLDRSNLRVVIFYIKRLATSSSSISYSHLGRTGNWAAHNLARVAENVADVVWTNEVPDVIWPSFVMN
jgi:hypothetical protein